MTQKAVADRAGTSQGTIARYERGEVSPSVETLQRLVRACGLELRFSIDEPLDSHDLGMIDYAQRMSPEDRLRSVANVSRLAAGAVRV